MLSKKFYDETPFSRFLMLVLGVQIPKQYAIDDICSWPKYNTGRACSQKKDPFLLVCSLEPLKVIHGKICFDQ